MAPNTIQGRLNAVRQAWDSITSRTRIALTGTTHPNLSDEDEKYLVRKMHDCILGNRGETASKAAAADLGVTYLHLSKTGKKKFFSILARKFDVDLQAIEQDIDTVRTSDDDAERMQARLALRTALVPPRIRLLKLLNRLPDGFKFLIDMRADLRALKSRDPYLRSLDADLKELLASWFDISLLDLQEIRWDSPAALLEKLIAYEAVHEIRSWKDLKHRLQSDRRCFGFFHNKMPNEPLIFVEVALVNGLADNIRTLLDETTGTLAPAKADTAIFYSISSTQQGLAGISMGNFLIKQVVERVSGELKNVKQFATLSPLPLFMRWIEKEYVPGDDPVLNEKERSALAGVVKGDDFKAGLAAVLAGDWRSDPKRAKALKKPLLKLAAHYLAAARHRGRAFDPVAHFHLTNGARIERLNWLADTSDKGLAQSAGLMVNYRYKLADIDVNHERYVARSNPACSRSIRAHLE